MFLTSIVVLLFLASSVASQTYTQPEQVHLSYGSDPNEMTVTWVTPDPTTSSIVEYGTSTLDQQASGTSELFVDGGPAKRKMYIHRVTITGLPDTQDLYYYHCGGPDGWSPTFTFRPMRRGTDWSPRFVVYGDMGSVNAQSLPRLQEEVTRNMYDAVLHVGDMAYDMDTNDAKYGDQFMRQIEPIAAYIPYMTCPGNHEGAYNFSNYVNRLSMKGLDGNINNHFYSWNIGPAHIISFSTEFYFFINYGIMQIPRQYSWLEKDLQEATKPENRAQRPWIITMAHRPMYCSNDDNDDCTRHESIIRTGIPIFHAYGLEKLFHQYGVDLELWAHEHSYERLWPVYDRKVYNGSMEEPYKNPKAPVHIITGSAGCQEKHDPFKNPEPWSAFRSSDYGYSRLTIYNKTHLYLEQVSDDLGGKVVDSMMLVKDLHGPEAWQ